MFRSIVNTLVNCFKIPELKSRILFTVAVLAICRLIAFVRIPGLDGDALTAHFNGKSADGGLLGMYSLFTGGALEHCAVGALGIMPYISVAIVISLLIAVVVAVKNRARQPGHNLPR